MAESRWTADEERQILGIYRRPPPISNDSLAELERLCKPHVEQKANKVCGARGLDTHTVAGEALSRLLELLWMRGCDWFMNDEHLLGGLANMIHFKVLEAADKGQWRRWRGSVDDATPSPKDWLLEIMNREEQDHLASLVTMCYGDLTLSEREILDRRYSDNWTLKQIGDLIGMTGQGVGKIVGRAIGKLQDCIKAKLTR